MIGAPGTPPTFFDWLDRLSTTYMRGALSAGWYNITLSLVGNQAVESWILACRMHLLDDPESPDDVLPILALDRGLQAYVNETPAQHRARLLDAWNIYPEGGTEEVIEKQLLAAGYGPSSFLGDFGDTTVSFGDPYYFRDRGCYVEFRPTMSGPRGEPAPYRTQFWIVMNTGFHPVTGLPLPWGDWDWGDLSDGVWSYPGLTQDVQRTLLGIVKKWKPSDHVFRGFTFLISNIAFKDPSVTFGDTTLLFGGALEWLVSA